MKKYKNIRQKALIVESKDSIDKVFREMALVSESDIKIKGVAFITKKEKLLGIVTDGDIRRAYGSNINFNAPISKIMNENFIYYCIESEKFSNDSNTKKYNFYPVLDKRKNLLDVVKREDIILKNNYDITITTHYFRS